MPPKRSAWIYLSQSTEIDGAPIARSLQLGPSAGPRKRYRHPLLLHQLQRLLRIEGGLQHDAAPR